MDTALIIKLSEARYKRDFTLDDLIASCGDVLLYKIPGSKWVATWIRPRDSGDFTKDYVNHSPYDVFTGDTPRDAVARLYLDIKE